MTIMLYGFLGKQFGKVHRYEVKNAAEAIKALSATIKGFRQAFIDGGSYKILRGGKEQLSLSQTIEPQSTRETIRIIPVVQGRGDLGEIVVGAAIMFFAPELAPMLGSFGVGVAAAEAAIFSFGMSLVLGGVASLLFSPEVTTNQSVERPENKPSYAFDGPVNTVAQGNPVPVCYGEVLAGSQVISAGLAVEQI